MIYRIYNPNTGHGFDPVESEDPAAWIAEKASTAGFDSEGYIWEPSTYVEPTPPNHVPDAAAKLAAGRTFGSLLIEEFRVAATAASLDLDTSEFLYEKLKRAEYWLREGHIEVAREAMWRVSPIAGLFPESVKNDYLQWIDHYLATGDMQKPPQNP